MASSLSLIMINSRQGDLFTGEPRIYETKMVDQLYYCALISHSQQIIDLIFGELEYIAITQLDHDQPLTMMSSIISKYKNMFENSALRHEVCLGLLTFLSNVMGHIVKSDYSLYETGKGLNKLMRVSSLLRCVFVPIVQSIYTALFKEKGQFENLGNFIIFEISYRIQANLHKDFERYLGIFDYFQGNC